MARKKKKKVAKKRGRKPALKKPIPRKPTRVELKKAYLEAYGMIGQHTLAAEQIGINPRTAQRWRREDPKFSEALLVEQQNVADMLEDECFRRAHDGVKRPVYQSGKLVGYVQEYSDTCLIFSLKGLRPEKYRDRYDVQSRAEVTQRGTLNVYIPDNGRDKPED